MPEKAAESALITWRAPKCPFTIEYSARALDDIRLAVTDAFFSLPRGGAEIGGILLGTFGGDRLSVLDYAPLECEHAFGPSFTISLNDEARLKELLAGARANFPGMKVVGWYHSHTRSGIFLSEPDLEIYKLYFPEPWQIALVMKPHAFEATRIGFFFREPDGRIHAEASYHEEALEPQPMRQIVQEAPRPAVGTPRPARPGRDAVRQLLKQVELDVTAEPVVEPAVPPPAVAPAARVFTPEPPSPAPAAKAAEPEVRQEPPVPQFLTQQEPSRRRWWLTALLAAAVTIGAIVAAVQTRDLLLPKFIAAVKPAPPAPPVPPSLGLRAAEYEGQLLINWDRNSAGVQQGTDGLLEISDGGPQPQPIHLDAGHLRTGTFTYARQSERVDVRLSVRRAGEPELHEVTTFLGKLPDRKPPAEDEVARKQREQLAADAAKLKTDLNWQMLKTKKLEKDLQTVRDELRKQQQKRLLNQAREGKQ